VAAGSVHEVLTSGRATGLVVRVQDLQAGAAVLNGAGIDAALSDGVIRVRLPVAQSELVSRTLAANGLYVTELRPEEVSLESVFLELTGEPAAGSGE
jgi:ABC-2 type transport system ATP-binding protein